MFTCPTLALQAYHLAVQRIRDGRDTGFYQRAVKLYNTSTAEDPAQPAVVDAAWAEQVTARNVQERNKLEVELKTYQSNMIKESIRVSALCLANVQMQTLSDSSQMAHRDLGNFYRSVGDDSTALKHYTKSREFCTVSQHVLEMCLSVLEVGSSSFRGSSRALTRRSSSSSNATTRTSRRTSSKPTQQST